jgi:DNA-3-methyladenine glycosylase II
MPDEQSFDLDPPAPFSLDLTAWALRRRSHNEVDRWGAAGYQRVITVEDRPVAVSVTQDGGLDSPRLSVQLAGRPIDQRVEVLVYGALRKLLGLTVDLTEFAAMAKQDALLGPLAGRLRGLKPPRFPTVFEALVNAVACQQLSLTVGIHLLNRITAAYGCPVEQSPQGPRAFPTPEQLAALEPADLQHPPVASVAIRGGRGPLGSLLCGRGRVHCALAGARSPAEMTSASATATGSQSIRRNPVSPERRRPASGR